METGAPSGHGDYLNSQDGKGWNQVCLALTPVQGRLEAGRAARPRPSGALIPAWSLDDLSRGAGCLVPGLPLFACGVGSSRPPPCLDRGYRVGSPVSPGSEQTLGRGLPPFHI